MTDPIHAATLPLARTAQETAQANPAANTLSADFETFLQLLTTQMKNQDPTKPQDSTEFISQLASFSAVEQQVATNEKLQQLIDAMAGDSMSGLANWIGADVRSTAAARFNGNPIEVNYEVDAEADNAHLTITGSDGSLVSKLPLDLNAETISWDGRDADGNAVAPDLYSFRVVSQKGDTLLNGTAAETYSTVKEARLEDGKTWLIFEDGTRLDASSAAFVRAQDTHNGT